MTHPLAADAAQALQGVTDGWSIYQMPNLMNDVNRRFIAFARAWVPEAAAALTALSAEAAALKAQVAELTRDKRLIVEERDRTFALMLSRAETAEAKVARLEGASNERPDAPAHIVEYTNYRGETARRIIIPIRMWWGSTEWHPQEQWMLTAWDVEKEARRDFAWQDMKPAQNPGTSAARAALTEGDTNG